MVSIHNARDALLPIARMGDVHSATQDTYPPPQDSVSTASYPTATTAYSQEIAPHAKQASPLTQQMQHVLNVMYQTAWPVTLKTVAQIVLLDLVPAMVSAITVQWRIVHFVPMLIISVLPVMHSTRCQEELVFSA